MTKLSDMRILLVNDDGIDATGMQILEEAARQLSDDVWVVAPARNRSGASHSLSIGTPIRTERRGPRHFAITGTPTECTMLGIHELLHDRPPSICISGINQGPNLAEDAAYSGTIAAAREASQLGVPAISMSQLFAPGEQDFTVGEHREIHWETSRRWCAPLLRVLLQQDFEAGVFLNVNFPGVTPEKVRGLRATIQGQRPPGCYVPKERKDSNGDPCYEVVLAYRDGDSHPDSDLRAVADNYISVTPLKVDLSALAYREKLVASLPGTLP